LTTRRGRLATTPPAAVVSLAALAGCQSPPAASVETAHPVQVPGIAAAIPPTGPTDEAVERVLAISIDGLNPRALTLLGPERTSAFHRLMREGAYTLNARTEYEMTKTLPNHTGMLTGRRIDEDKAGHGIGINSDSGTTVHQKADHYVASIFDVVHDQGGKTALFSATTKFELYERTWNTDGRPDTVGQPGTSTASWARSTCPRCARPTGCSARCSTPSPPRSRSRRTPWWC
jgi:Type I phosphodiesterase / nucleotide pyrophosphatase